MKQRGQVFSVDFLISVMVIVLAIGLLLNFYELSVHAQMESNLSSELRNVAERAADLLVYSPEFTCELWEDAGETSQRIMYIPNCLVKGDSGNSGKEIIKAKLGLVGFQCEVSGKGEINAIHNPSNTGCEDDPPDATEIIVVKRTVYVTNKGTKGNERILKQDYNECIKEGCNTGNRELRGPYEITLKVWR